MGLRKVLGLGKCLSHELVEFAFGEMERGAGFARVGEEDGTEGLVNQGFLDNAFDGFFGQDALLS